MMHTWFEVKIRYEKVVENGMQKKLQSHIFLMLLVLLKVRENVSKK